MTLEVCVALIPLKGGPRSVGESPSYVYGGDPYRSIAESILSSQVDLRHVAWPPVASPSEGDAWDDVARDADALVIAPWLSLIDPSAFEGFRLDRVPQLKVIAGTFDFRLGWIDPDEAARRRITIVDTSRTMTTTVAEFGVGMTLALIRDIPASIELVRAGGWLHGPVENGSGVVRDLSDHGIGLAGYGSINRHYRRFVRPYGCAIHIYDPFVSDTVADAEDVVRASSLVELARTSDIFVVAIPPTPSTLGVVDAAVIEALPTGSLCILLSRMAVVEQEPLWRRLRAKELKAAIDVFDPEPPPTDAWFRRAPNVLPTPHIAGNVTFAHERCFREACADALRVLRGRSPLYAATERDTGIYDGSLAAAARGPSATE